MSQLVHVRVVETLMKLRQGYAAERLDAMLSEAAKTEQTYLDFLDGLLREEVGSGCGPEKGSRITSKEIHLYALCNGDDGMVSLGCHHGTAAVSDQSTSASR